MHFLIITKLRISFLKRGIKLMKGIIALILLFSCLNTCIKSGIPVLIKNPNPGFSYMTDDVFETDFASNIIPANTNQPANDMIAYFQNLYNYSPSNYDGSCGYVSLIQYLSYYDCFYNDSIIPEIYERNQGSVSSFDLARLISPGVIKQTYPPTDLISVYNTVQNNCSFDYQMNLMNIVNQSFNHDPNNYTNSIGMWDYYRILNTISAFANTSFCYTRVQDFGANAKPTDANVANWFDFYVKSQLSQGNPVVIHIAQYDENTGYYEKYHSVVAYYYDNDGIHANFGWGPNSTNVLINGYQITEAGVIDFYYVSESHSHNYIINNSGYCGCGIATSHTYNHHYDSYSNQQHKSYCSCGSYTLDSHSVDASSIYHYHGHAYAPCMYCGEVVEIGGNGPLIPIIYGNNYLMVTNNGSYILTNGIYVIEPADMESFINGTLVFHPYYCLLE